jgi:hypothetical protein
MRQLPTRLAALALAAAWVGAGPGFAEKPTRVGTTAGNFLEMGFGAAGSAMGDAAVASASDVSAVYWNPARLAALRQNEVQFLAQPWFAGITTSGLSAAVVSPRWGAFAVQYCQASYGEMRVTTMDYQDGTGEFFTARDYSVSAAYARNLAQWFSFGAAAKFVGSSIWHCSAGAPALDLGVSVNTSFFSVTGDRSDGMTIGMSIANYGGKLRYDGMDLMQPIDLYPYENGNYKYAEGQFRTQAWELPLIFRIGAAVRPLATENHRLTLEVNALHPNNNAESVNVGAQYEAHMPSVGTFYLRGGYRALFLPDSEYGASFGAGVVKRLMHRTALKVDYTYRDIGLLGAVHCYSFGLLF